MDGESQVEGHIFWNEESYLHVHKSSRAMCRVTLAIDASAGFTALLDCYLRHDWKSLFLLQGFSKSAP